MRWTENDYFAYQVRQGQASVPVPLTAGEAAAIAESRLLDKIVALAKQTGWLAYHTHDSRRSEEGFPDLVLVSTNAVIFAELKSATGKPTEAQLLWLEMLRHAGAEAYLWRPADWPAIQERLMHGRTASPKEQISDL